MQRPLHREYQTDEAVSEQRLPLSQRLRLPRLPGQFVGRPARSRMQILTGGDARGPQCLAAVCVCVLVCVLPSSLFYNSLTG